jgi:hypothetical protein
MNDFILIAGLMIFFGLSAAYLRACSKLQEDAWKS